MHLDDEIKEYFLDYEEYMTELIRTLREYNGLGMENVELVFEDVFDLPDDIKEKYGIDKSIKINTRFINSSMPRD